MIEETTYEQLVCILRIPRDSTTLYDHCQVCFIVLAECVELFTGRGKFRGFISHVPTSSCHKSLALSQRTDTVMMLMMSTTAYCLVLRATKYRDVMGTRV